MILFLVQLLLLIAIANAKKSSLYEPFTLLKREHLIGLFPFDENLSDVSRIARNSGSSSSSKGINALKAISSSDNPFYSQLSVQDSSVYFTGDNYMTIPISLDPIKFPKVTIGAWVRIASSSDHALMKNVRYLFSSRTAPFRKNFR